MSFQKGISYSCKVVLLVKAKQQKNTYHSDRQPSYSKKHLNLQIILLTLEDLFIIKYNKNYCLMKMNQYSSLMKNQRIKKIMKEHLFNEIKISSLTFYRQFFKSTKTVTTNTNWRQYRTIHNNQFSICKIRITIFIMKT